MADRLVIQGVLHEIAVAPNDNGTGWLLQVSSPRGSIIVSLPEEDATTLGNFLLENQPPAQYEEILGLYIPGGVNDITPLEDSTDG